MEELIQHAISEAPPPAGMTGAVFWIIVGAVLVIQLADKIIFWIRSFYSKKNGTGHRECDRLAKEIGELTKTVERVAVLIEKDREKWVRANDQISELHAWHQPDSQGQQSWKNYAVISTLNRLSGMVSKLIDEFQHATRNIFSELRHIKNNLQK